MRLNFAVPVAVLSAAVLPLCSAQNHNPHANNLEYRAPPPPPPPPPAPPGPAGPPTLGLDCPKIAPGPVSGNFLAEQLTVPLIIDVGATEAIRQTLGLYALAIDGRNFEALRKVFTNDVRANYSDPIGVLNGVQAIIDTLPPGLNSFASTQHLLGTMFIQVCGWQSAVSVTYFQASHFFVPYTGVGNTIGNDMVLIDRAQYQDTWARQKDGSWKISNRNLVRMVSISLWRMAISTLFKLFFDKSNSSAGSHDSGWRLPYYRIERYPPVTGLLLFCMLHSLFLFQLRPQEDFLYLLRRF
jgi:hypothetical protein